MSLAALVTTLAIGSSLALAVAPLVRPPRTAVRCAFSLGMLAWALEGAAAAVLLTQTETPEARALWLGLLEIAGLAVLIPWGAFALVLLGFPGRRIAATAIGAAAIVAVSGIATMAYEPLFLVSNLPGPFFAASVVGWGRIAVLAQLIGTIGILAGLEATLRSTRGHARWRIKYLVIGLGGVFLGRFYFLSQVALFNVLFAAFVTSATAMVPIGNLVIGISLARDRLGAGLTVSRELVYRSAVVGVLGIYLLAVGVLAWVLKDLGQPDQIFWGSVIVFVSAVALALAMLSEAIRWRIKRFVVSNFYRSKYDYRVQWGNFTRRLGSLVSVEKLAPELLGAVLETVGATRAVLYLVDPRDKSYHAIAAAGTPRPEGSHGASAPLPQALRERSTPLVLGESCPVDWLDPGLVQALGRGALVAPLRWRGDLLGFMAVGVERTGRPYGVEDLEFLATVGEQAAGTLATAQLAETVTQSREFEAFHRVTSFVIHDLKNSISSLSLLSENALRNFDDVEFQRDAIKTVSRNVERMRALLARLKTGPDAEGMRPELTDLALVAAEGLDMVGARARGSLVRELAPAKPVTVDREALARVTQNLVANAFDALAGDGVVTVKTYTDGASAVLSVSDTGCGIPEDFLRHALFTPFRSTKKGGWGIGLYQCKAIVEAHRGTIEVASKEGTGTTFWVRLPIE